MRNIKRSKLLTCFTRNIVQKQLIHYYDSQYLCINSDAVDKYNTVSTQRSLKNLIKTQFKDIMNDNL